MNYSTYQPAYAVHLKQECAAAGISLGKPLTPTMLGAYFRAKLAAVAGAEDDKESLMQQLAVDLAVMQLEAAAAFIGVELRVDDIALVEALLRSDVEAIIGDMRLPFPVCEFVFPAGIDVPGTGRQVSAVIIFDNRLFDVDAYWADYDASIFDSVSPPDYTALTCRPEGVAAISFNCDEPISTDTMHTAGKEIDSADVKYSKAMIYLCVALCLYLQTKEGQKALEAKPATAERVHRSGVPSAVSATLKRRKSYKVLDLIPDKYYKADNAHPGNTANGGKRTHWRRLHMRSLRDERYRRNNDGSVRVIWVRPTRVGVGASSVKQIRRAA